jgi:hypothetical protein
MNKFRNNFLAFAFLLSMGLLTAPPPANAQLDAHIIQVTIPFAFHAGEEILPPGTYRLENRLSHSILLRGPNNKSVSVLVFDAVSLRSHKTGRVVFHRYGETYFLREIWYSENPSGVECYSSRAEKSMLRALNNQLPSSINLALTPYGASIDRR